MSAAGVAFVDGAYLPVEEARVPILDWGFLRSDATYDVVHVRHGAFFRLADHVERFRRGMERLRLSLPGGTPPVEEVARPDRRPAPALTTPVRRRSS